MLIGQGTRLFPESGPDRALELKESKAMSNGVVVQSYHPKGRPQYGATSDTTQAWSGATLSFSEPVGGHRPSASYLFSSVARAYGATRSPYASGRRSR